MMGSLNTDEIEELLHRSILGRVGCTDGKLIYVVPISFVYDGQYVYCHTHEGLKINILRKNPSVCFEVELLENMANWQTVIAQGEFEEQTDAASRLDALQKLYDRKLPVIASQTMHLAEEWPFVSETLSQLKGVVFRIRLDSKSGRFEKTHPLSDVFY